ncbi:unnamed protein product [Linum tenue]|uniref:NAD-dependent epimerase/dehydratase domain-containing protein n=1 Tax=Linum tenue TaxID=586396 RepID=A0AAV0KTD9_9ROSI|nr:unnamed protein product [Linum tenue]
MPAFKMGFQKLQGTVCVTGAGGFLGSWVVHLLLSKNYLVRGTVRDPLDEKYAHLNQLPNASSNLKLVKADLLDYPSLFSAIQGCSGVFHVASPLPSSPVDLIEPAVTGTLNVLKACLEAKVERVVVVSSGAALMMNPSWPDTRAMDESCWSDVEHCRAIEVWLLLLSYDVAEALVLVYEKPEAQGRYICTSHSVHVKDIVDILKDEYPSYNYPKK